MTKKIKKKHIRRPLGVKKRLKNVHVKKLPKIKKSKFKPTFKTLKIKQG